MNISISGKVKSYEYVYAFKIFSSHISFVHCFLSTFVGFLIFIISHYNQPNKEDKDFRRYNKPNKIPITIFSKTFSFLQNVKMFKLRRKSLDEQADQKFEKEKEIIQNEMEEQAKVDWQVLKENI